MHFWHLPLSSPAVLKQVTSLGAKEAVRTKVLHSNSLIGVHAERDS
jgi:hypothetical protein